MSGFMFATGIENSYPTIANGTRVDEMEKCGHYARWREDLALTRDMGLQFLRWGPALHKTFLGPGKYDWSWTDEVIAEMRRLRIEPIVDLLHFGLPDWLGNFQSREVPHFHAEYAGAFARRYPFLRYWTPVNEAYITAMFSGRYGWWNERLSSEQGFVRATLNLAKASLLAMHAIRESVADPVFVQVESCEFHHAAVPAAEEPAEFQNQRRFLPLDLMYGVDSGREMAAYLRDNGMTEEEAGFFDAFGTTENCLLGTDYYATNEHLVQANGESCSAGDVLGYHTIARQYYDRYRVPLMFTETNRKEEEDSTGWLRKQWYALLQLRRDGVPVVGFTWFSLTDQKDWDTALREDQHRVNSVGLYDLDRRIRPVGEAFRQIVADWQDALPVSVINRPLKLFRKAG